MIEEIRSQYLTAYEFQTYPLPFYLFTALGLWCPSDWSPDAKRKYYMYTILQYSVGGLFLFQSLVYIGTTIFKYHHVETNPAFGAIAIIFGFVRVSTYIFDQTWVLEILKLAFNERFMKPRNEEETEIIKSFSTNLKKIHLMYVLTLGFASTVKVSFPLVQYRLSMVDALQSLPVTAWYPYNVSTPVLYELTIFHEFLAASSTVCANIGADILVSAVMMQVCLQFKILGYRISNIGVYADDEPPMNDIYKQYRDQRDIRNFVIDHRFIISLAEKSNEAFMLWLMIMVIFPGPSLIVNVFEVLSADDISNTVAPGALIIIVFAQLFLIYWCGSDIKDESVELKEAVFRSGWINLHRKVRRDYLFIMQRSFHRPVTMTVVKIINLNVNSMVALVKLAYSALNLFRNTS